MNNLNTFSFESNPVRVVMGEDGKPRFFATDVAKTLGYAQPEKAVRTHCRGVSVLDTPINGVNQSVNVIAEADVYRLVMRSKLPSAEKFQDWVVEEVLPTIRKTGSYQVQDFRVPKTFAEALSLAAEQAKELECKTATITVLEPKAEYHDRVNDSNGCHTMAEAAQILGTGQNRLFSALRHLGYIVAGSTRPYQAHVDAGLFKVVEKVFEDVHGVDRINAKTLITGKGMVSIEKKMRAAGIIVGSRFVGVAA